MSLRLMPTSFDENVKKAKEAFQTGGAIFMEFQGRLKSPRDFPVRMTFIKSAADRCMTLHVVTFEGPDIGACDVVDVRILLDRDQTADLAKSLTEWLQFAFEEKTK